MLASIIGVYMLVGEVGNYLAGWFIEMVDFDTVPAIAAACMGVLMAEVVRLQWKRWRSLSCP